MWWSVSHYEQNQNSPFKDFEDNMSNSLTLIGALCPQHFENMAIARHKTTNEYFQYLFEPLDFTAPAHPCACGISASMHVIPRLVALIPKPRVNLTRFDLQGCNECRGRRDAQKRPWCFRTE